MPEAIDGDGRRGGCLAGRLLGGAARLMLVYPQAAIGSHLGQAAQGAIWPDAGTPYEGALIGMVVGALIGLSLWRLALAADDWRSKLADATLLTVTVLWLSALFVSATTPVPASELVIAWAACLAGSASIVLLLRA